MVFPHETSTCWVILISQTGGPREKRGFVSPVSRRRRQTARETSDDPADPSRLQRLGPSRQVESRRTSHGLPGAAERTRPLPTGPDGTGSGGETEKEKEK